MKSKILAVLGNKWLVALLKALLGAVFLFSGFVKAVDPLGTAYKITDYLTAFSMSALSGDDLTLYASMAQAGVEMLLGICLLLSIYHRKSSFLALLFMVFYTPLTLYIALTDPVSDCGCFGDALVLTNWQTFWKNVVLLVLSILVYRSWRVHLNILHKRLEWMVLLVGFLFSLALELQCLWQLPVLDFRPYRIGASIPEGMVIPEDAPQSQWDTHFILKKDGVEKSFTLEDYPDSTWTYVRTDTKLIKKGYEPPIHDFSLMELETGDDITDEVITDPGYVFLMVAHRIEKADEANVDLINELFDYTQKYGYGFYCLTSSQEEDIERWRDDTGAEYPFCLVDDITLKTIVRSNPGVVLIKDGVILQKWSNDQIPDEYQLTAPLEQLSIGSVREVNDTRTVLIAMAMLFGPIILLVFVQMPSLREELKRNKITD